MPADLKLVIPEPKKPKNVRAGRVRLMAALARHKDGTPRDTFETFTPRDGHLVVPPGDQFHGRPFLQIENAEGEVELTLVFLEEGMHCVLPDGSEMPVDYASLALEIWAHASQEMG